MKITRCNWEKPARPGRCLGWWLCALLALGPGDAKADDLQGLSVGSTNWVKLTLQGWNELDYVPGKILLTGGPTTGRTVTLNFNHTKGSIPQIELVAGFWTSANVVITSPPVLSAPAGMDTWSYTFTVNQLDRNQGTVYFNSRVSAGAHLAAGSLLHFTSRTLQINQPCAAPGSPDLTLVKSGPATGQPGSVITYTLHYTNNSGFKATGVQVTDILPAQVTFVSGDTSGPNYQLGDTLTWDLGTLPPGAGGSLTYQVLVGAGVPVGQTFCSTATILSAENDANPADNSSTATTSVQTCETPGITADPAGATNSLGGPAVFSVAATGGSLNYQWRKNGVAIPGATQSSYMIAATANADAAYYDVLATNACGTAISAAAPLALAQPLTGGQMLPNQNFQLNAATISNRTYSVQYSPDLTNWKTAETGLVASGTTLQWLDCGAPKTECAPMAATARFYRVLLLP